MRAMSCSLEAFKGSVNSTHISEDLTPQKVVDIHTLDIFKDW